MRKKCTGLGYDPYDGIRLWSALTHGLGAFLSVAATVWLIVKTALSGGDAWKIVSFAVYGSSMFCLYLASTLYHSVKAPVRGRVALKKYDHISIFLLIAGTYTPVCLVVLRDTVGWWLFGIIWALAALGLVMKLLWVGCPRWVSSVIYIGMGWTAAAVLYPLLKAVGLKGVLLLVAGGVVYTVGGVLYALKWPGKDNPRFGDHEVFHVIILLGSAVMYLVMRFVVLPY